MKDQMKERPGPLSKRLGINERYAQVRADVMAEIRELRDAGYSMTAIGEAYGVTRGAVNNFLKGHSRKD